MNDIYERSNESESKNIFILWKENNKAEIILCQKKLAALFILFDAGTYIYGDF